MTNRNRPSILRRTFLLTFAVAIGHYILSWACFLGGAALGMSDFDSGLSLAGKIGHLIFDFAQVLWWPMWKIATAHPRDTSTVAQHGLIALNSLLWGLLTATLVLTFQQRKRLA